MEDEESLQAGTVVSQLANTIEDEVNDFLLFFFNEEEGMEYC